MNTQPHKNIRHLTLKAMAGAAALASVVALAAAAPDLNVVEYFHRPTQHYFITATPSEQSQLDALPGSVGFARTGRSFSAWSPAQVNRPSDTVAVERFFVPALASHVFTANTSEIAALRALPLSSTGAGFVDEGVAFYALQPLDGRCTSGLRAIYRTFNHRQDGNHRYVSDLSLLAAMVSGGFVNEDVAFCSNLVGEDASAEASAGAPRPVGERAQVAGAVTGFVSLSDFTVAAQRVNAANARFDHGAPSALGNGVSVTVEGVWVGGVLLAKEVKLPTATPLSGDEMKGFINAIGSNGRLFVNGVAVDVSGATVLNTPIIQWAVGLPVELRGAFLNGVFVASSVHVDDALSANGTLISGDAEVKGAVTNYLTIGNFTVQGQVVDASGAMFDGGAATAVANGAVVEVHGRVSSGVLVASRVEVKSNPTVLLPPFESTPDAEFEATGTVSAFVSAASFKLNGASVNATNAKFERGTAANLGNGVTVEIRGLLENGLVTATRVRFER